MSDTYTVNPVNVFPGTSTNITVNYESPNLVVGTTYTLKANTGITLGTNTYNTVVKSTFSGPNTGEWAIAADSSGTVYIQSGSTKVIKIYSSAGVLSGTTITGPVQYIITCSSPDPNLIYWGGNGYFSVLNASAKTLTHRTYSPPNLCAIGYNNFDNFVYGAIGQAFRLFKINPIDGSYTTIFTDNGTYGLPTANQNYFRSIAVGNDGILYCIAVNDGTIWKFNTSGTLIGLFTTLTGITYGSAVGLSYSSSANCFYAQTTEGKIFKVSTSGSVTLLTTSPAGIYWESYFNPYTNAFYLHNNGSVITTVTFATGINYTFSSNLLTNNDQTAQLYNGAVQFGIPITIFTYPCFKQGAKILRYDPVSDKESYVPVETLRRGDLIVTAESGAKPIHSIGYKPIPLPKSDSNPSNRLYKFSRKYCPDVFEPLYITGEHCTLHHQVSQDLLSKIAEHMGDVYVTENHYRVPAQMDDRAEPYDGEDEPVTIWHFALENENVAHNYGVWANGLLVESCAIESLLEKSGMRLLE